MGWFTKKQKPEEPATVETPVESVPQEQPSAPEVTKSSEQDKDKSGYIYIISNVGSFGPDIFKIGMTKASDPMKRIKDLSDASVPFNFAVHALIPVEDAGAAEAQFHRFLRDKEVNKINHKKEFFRTSLEEIKDITKKLGYKVKWDDNAVDVNYLKSKELN